MQEKSQQVTAQHLSVLNPRLSFHQMLHHSLENTSALSMPDPALGMHRYLTHLVNRKSMLCLS